jgi:hypothetical protein
MQRVNVYLKVNVLPLPFASNNICPWVFGLRGKFGFGWEREGWGPSQFCSNLLPFRGKWN